MKPDYDELLNGTTQWRSSHKEVGILLSFHGYREGEYRHQGTWCYYLMLDQQMFSDEHWKQLHLEYTEGEYGLDYDYYRFPDVDFHCGITFYETDKYYDHKTKKYIETVKAGCDYAHLWDNERGYPDTYNTVLWDAKRSVDILLGQFPPMRIRCEYSGIWDTPDNFYLAKMGKMVHNSCLEKIKENGWDNWLPKENNNERL